MFGFAVIKIDFKWVDLCCQSGNAVGRGHPKNWRGAGCGRI